MVRLRKKTLGVLVAATIVAIVIGYFVVPRMLYGALAGLHDADELTLYSIDGTVDAAVPPITNEEFFYGFAILGKVQIKDPQARREIIARIKSAVARSEWGVHMKCFWPRHGLRIVRHGKQLDLVVCFQCNDLRAYSDEGESSEPVSNAPQESLNGILRDEGIPLPPPPEY